MQDTFDPYSAWLGLMPIANYKPNHYEILGLTAFEVEPKTIAQAAERQLSRLLAITPETNRAVWQRLVSELAAAQSTLTHPQHKQEYDQKLRLFGTSQKPEKQPGRVNAPLTGTAKSVAKPHLGAQEKVAAGNPIGKQTSKRQIDPAPVQIHQQPIGYAGVLPDAATQSPQPQIPQPITPIGYVPKQAAAPFAGDVPRTPSGNELGGSVLSDSTTWVPGMPTNPQKQPSAGAFSVSSAPQSGTAIPGNPLYGVPPAIPNPMAPVPLGNPAFAGPPQLPGVNPLLPQQIYKQALPAIDSGVNGLPPGAAALNPHLAAYVDHAASAPVNELAAALEGNSSSGRIAASHALRRQYNSQQTYVIVCGIAIAAAVAVALAVNGLGKNLNESERLTKQKSTAAESEKSSTEREKQVYPPLNSASPAVAPNSNELKTATPTQNNKGNPVKTPPRVKPNNQPTKSPANPAPETPSASNATTPEPNPPAITSQPASSPPPSTTPSVVTALPSPKPSGDPPPLPLKATVAEKKAFLPKLTEIRVSLAERKFDVAKQQLAAAKLLAHSDDLQEILAGMETVANDCGEFWKVVRDSLKVLEGEIDVGSSKGFVVTSSPTEITIRLAGKNETYQFENLPPDLALAIADRWLDERPANKAILGSYYFVQQRINKLDEARRLWIEAQQGGVNCQAQLLLLEQTGK